MQFPNHVKQLLQAHFPTFKLVGVPTVGKVTIRCTDSGQTMTLPWGALRKHVLSGGRSLASPSVQENLTGGHTVFAAKLDQRFGSGVLKLASKFTGMQSKVKVVHGCGSTQTVKASALLTQPYACSCTRFAAKAPFVWMTRSEQAVLQGCRTNLGLTQAQTAELTGVKQDSQEGLFNQRSYGVVADRIARYVASAYADVMPKGAKLSYHLSKHDGFTRYSKPVPLRVLCHPANLRPVGAGDMPKKSISLRQLKQRIARFEAKHGPFVLPAAYCDTFDAPKTQKVEGGALRVLGLDPGTANFGVFGGVVRGAQSIDSIEPLVTKMFANPVKNLARDLRDATARFTAEFNAILEAVHPDVVVVERFQTRGLKGPTVELVSFMVGLIHTLCSAYSDKVGRPIEVRPVVAGQWKNAVNRKISLEGMYEDLGSTKLHHRLDAMLMALYAFPNKDVYACLTAKRQAGIVNYIKATQ